MGPMAEYGEGDIWVISTNGLFAAPPPPPPPSSSSSSGSVSASAGGLLVVRSLWHRPTADGLLQVELLPANAPCPSAPPRTNCSTSSFLKTHGRSFDDEDDKRSGGNGKGRGKGQIRSPGRFNGSKSGSYGGGGANGGLDVFALRCFNDRSILDELDLLTAAAARASTLDLFSENAALGIAPTAIPNSSATRMGNIRGGAPAMSFSNALLVRPPLLGRGVLPASSAAPPRAGVPSVTMLTAAGSAAAAATTTAAAAASFFPLRHALAAGPAASRLNPSLGSTCGSCRPLSSPLESAMQLRATDIHDLVAIEKGIVSAFALNQEQVFLSLPPAYSDCWRSYF